MKILDVDVRPWDIPMRAPYRSAQRTTTLARNVLATCRLEDGSTGYGESAPAPYVTGESQETVCARALDLARLLRGRDVGEAAALLAEQVYTSPGACGALETALADAAARAAGLPLFRFLAVGGSTGGGADAPAERSTDLSLPLLPPTEAARRAAEARGFRALKIKVGGGDLGEDIARVRAVAEAAPAAALRLDGNQGLTPEQAVRLFDQLAPLAGRIELLEQPTPAHDDASLAWVAVRVPVPVFADEAVKTPEDAARLIGSGACAGVVLKLAKSGLSGAAAIARTARAAGGRCLFGCMMETRVAVGAALHLALALGADAVPFLDLDGHLLVDDRAVVSGGFSQAADTLRVDPDAAGLGLRAAPA